MITVPETMGFGTVDDLGRSKKKKKKKGLKRFISKISKGAKGIKKLVTGIVGGGKADAPEEPEIETETAPSTPPVVAPVPVVAPSIFSGKPWLLPTLIGGGGVVILLGLLVMTSGRKGD